MSKSKAETATKYVALLGFLTAFCGMAQTMWTTSPWWRADKKAKEKVLDYDNPPAAAGEDDWGYVELTVASEEQTPTSIGVYGMLIGAVLLTIGLIINFILGRNRRKREKQILA